MLLTVTTTHTPASDLGYLLHKHPARVQQFEVSVGRWAVTLRAVLPRPLSPWPIHLATTNRVPVFDDLLAVS